MKKIWMALLAGLMLVGCSAPKTEEPAATATPEATAEATAEAAPAEQSPEALAGGWTVNESYNELLADDDKARFEKAIEGLVGVGYTPIQVIGTQVVNGTNYAYLASGTTVTAEPVSGYYIVNVNESSSGEISVVNIAQIDIADVKTRDAAGAALGGWQATDTGKPGMLPGEEAQSSFDAATKDGDMIYNPIVLLGTQVVAGTNYKALCRGKAADGTVNLYVVTWFAGVNGENTVLESALFDLESYVTPAE